MYYTTPKLHFGIFKFSKWPTAAILIFEEASMETTRLSSNFDSGHIQVAFLKYSAFYLFFHLKHLCSWTNRDLLIAVIREFFDRTPNAVGKLWRHKKGGHIIRKGKFIINFFENISFPMNTTYFLIPIKDRIRRLPKIFPFLSQNGKFQIFSDFFKKFQIFFIFIFRVMVIFVVSSPQFSMHFS